MGRAASGVKAMKLKKGDVIVGAEMVRKKLPKTLRFSSLWKKVTAKKPKLSEYKVQKRGGSGIKTAKVTPKTGALIASKIIVPGGNRRNCRHFKKESGYQS